MTLLQNIESRQGALKVKELAVLLEVTSARLYKLMSRGASPSVRIAGCDQLAPGWAQNWAH